MSFLHSKEKKVYLDKDNTVVGEEFIELHKFENGVGNGNCKIIGTSGTKTNNEIKISSQLSNVIGMTKKQLLDEYDINI